MLFFTCQMRKLTAKLSELHMVRHVGSGSPTAEPELSPMGETLAWVLPTHLPASTPIIHPRQTSPMCLSTYCNLIYSTIKLMVTGS